MTKVISDKSLLKSYSESDAKSNKSVLELASNNFDTLLKEAFLGKVASPFQINASWKDISYESAKLRKT